jgi:DNA-binding response OmpR family regulator
MSLNLNLPRVDGMGVLQEFRKDPQCAETPVIVVSSSDTAGERRRTAELGVAYYFQKPGDFDSYMELGAIVRAAMSSRPASLPLGHRFDSLLGPQRKLSACRVHARWHSLIDTSSRILELEPRFDTTMEQTTVIRYANKAELTSNDI